MGFKDFFRKRIIKQEEDSFKDLIPEEKNPTVSGNVTENLKPPANVSINNTGSSTGYKGNNKGNNNELSGAVYKENGEGIKRKNKNLPCRIIAITNQKGGVGKSTTAVNLSSFLGQLGYKTLVIDFDPQSNATSGLGIDKEFIKTSIYEVIISGENPRNALVQTAYPNLLIIPSSIRLAGAEVELVSTMKREYKLKTALDHVKNDFDFIIIDCPPALGLLTINALTAASEVLIPIQCEYYALEGLGQLMNTINLIRENLNEGLVITGVVMTMFDQRTKLSEQVIKEVRDFFPDKVYQTVIPRNIRLSEAPSYGKPIIEYDPECKGALAYKNLTKEVVGDGSE